MLFSSFPSIFYFLHSAILAAIVASFLPYQAYLSVLVIASAVFYYWHAPAYLVLIAGSALSNCYLASFIEDRNLTARLLGSVVGDRKVPALGWRELNR